MDSSLPSLDGDMDERCGPLMSREGSLPLHDDPSGYRADPPDSGHLYAGAPPALPPAATASHPIPPLNPPRVLTSWGVYP